MVGKGFQLDGFGFASARSRREDRGLALDPSLDPNGLSRDETEHGERRSHLSLSCWKTGGLVTKGDRTGSYRSLNNYAKVLKTELRLLSEPAEGSAATLGTARPAT